jgi:hypothetical protein
MKDHQPNGIDYKTVSRSDGPPSGSYLLACLEKIPIELARDRHTRSAHDLRVRLKNGRGGAPNVIGISVADEQRFQILGA